MSRTRNAGRKPAAHAVSRPHDSAETQADHAADTVARGGSVSGWSFGSVPAEASVHREEKGAAPKDDEKLKDAATKVGEAALETKTGKELQQQVKDAPLVKQATKFLESTTGKVVAGGALALGVGGLAAAKAPLPFQAPAIPLDSVTPGLSAKVTVEGPLNAPTFVGLSLSYKEQGAKGKGGPTQSEQIAADVARLRAEQEMFKPKAQKDQEKADEQAAVARLLANQANRFGSSTLLPLAPGAQPKTVDVPKQTNTEQPKEKDETPVQREPATAESQDSHEGAALDTSGVDAAVRGGGRQLDASTRRSMEARFGYDFGAVRIHDHAAAVGAASDLSATAFTVGEDIVFGSGGYDPSTAEGRHLLAHELAHVVQQRSSGPGAGERLHRRSVFESIGILLGLAEGTWSDQELHGYLDALTTKGKIDGSYDADNKARAVVRRWKQASPGFDLLGAQKALLIDEMLDGPTTGDDEECILDLLELSDASDLRTVFADAQKRMAALDSDIDGDNHDRLDAFVAARFKGGRAELQAGRVEVVGDTVPAAAPAYGFDPTTFDARLDTDRTASEVIALLDRYSADDRNKALDHLIHQVWPRSKSELGRARAESFADGATEAQKIAIFERTQPVRDRVAKTEQVLQHYFLAQVPATKADLTKSTKPVDPALAAEVREVLRPYQYAAEAKADEEVIELDEEPKAEPKVEPKLEPLLKGKTPDRPEKKPERAAFHDPEKYRGEVETALPGIIDAYYAKNVTDRGPRAKMDEIEAMAVVAKSETDAVFGQFYDQSKHPELKGDRKGKPGNLHFWYDTAERELKAMGPFERRQLATSWVLYYFQADSTIRLLNDKYNASPLFDKRDVAQNDEAKLLTKIAEKITKDAKTVTKLVETRRGWGGMASGRNIFVDLFHDANTEKDRKECWDMFQTLVHEYCHTLVHGKYEEFAKSFGTTSEQWNTLIEGVDCVLDEVVWAHVAPKVTDPALRKVVEGEAHAKLPAMDVPKPGRYPSYEEAFRLVGLVGISNIYAAYFLGLVDRISVPKDKTPKKPAKAPAKAGKP